MVDSNDPNLAKLNAEIAVLRVAVLNLIEMAAAQGIIAKKLRGDGATHELRSHGVPTVHVDAFARAQADFLKKLGYSDEQR